MDNTMPNAPIYYALAQAKFNPVLNMSRYVDEVQDELRRLGYTLFEQTEHNHLHISGVMGTNDIQPRLDKITTWLMSDRDRRAGFILRNDTIMYHTTHYKTRREFIPEFVKGIKAVHDIVKLDHISRLGVRALDAILPSEGETPENYLIKRLAGLPDRGNQIQASFETIIETNPEGFDWKGQMIAKMYRAKIPLGYPPGLNPFGLRPMERFRRSEPMLHAVIDIDHTVEKMIDLDWPAVESQMFKLYEMLKELFLSMVSEHAKEVWSRDA
ncbi:MAG: TIGR04255 family protein [Candidatus Competibacterales bacterium]